MNNTYPQNEAPNNFYALQGLEQLAGTFLKIPAGADVTIEPVVFARQLEEETASLQLLIKTQAFALGREKEIQLLVRRYHASLTRLLDDTLYKYQQQGEKQGNAEELYSLYTTWLERLIEFINDYFPEHHSPEQRVPIISLCRERKDLLPRLKTIEDKILSHPEEMVAGEIFKRLRHFALSSRPIPFKVRYRDLRYKEELLRQLEEIKWDGQADTLFTPVEHMLIYLNYNSKAFIRLLIRKISGDINRSGDIKEKLDTLLLYQKAFRQIHPKPGMVLNPGYHYLGRVLNDWFSEEIRYLEKKLELLKDRQDYQESDMVPKHLKVLLSLSGDQAALIIRGADEARIVVAKSMSAVFKTIAPYLSTPFREHVSPEGMRSKAYHPEQHDKDKAIAALETIIRKIRDY